MTWLRTVAVPLALTVTASASVVGTASAGAAEPTPVGFTGTVATGNDDAEETASGATTLTSTTLELVYARGNQTVGLRFTGVPVPPGSIVQSAWLSFKTAKVTTRPASLVVRAEAADDASAFAKAPYNISARSVTDASVAWAPAPWKVNREAGFPQWTPDLSAVVQEVVNRPGWTAGNSLAFVITGSGARAAKSKNAGSPPVLHIDYLPPAGGPDAGFLPADQALARPNPVVVNGVRTTQLRDGSPSANTTYDLRGMVSEAYLASITQYPVTFGSTTPAAGLVVVGGEVQGQNPTTWTWQDWEAAGKTGGAFYVSATDAALYNGRASNVFDYVKVRRATPSAHYLVQGCYGRYVRDDAVENDQEASITVRDCLFDGISMGISIGQELTNPTAVTRIEDTTFIFQAMPNTTADDGLGHSRLFKQLGAGTVDFRNVNVCFAENPMSSPDKLGLWMPGQYSNVNIVLGPGFTLGLDRFGSVPAGVTISRDWSICDQARTNWLATH